MSIFMLIMKSKPTKEQIYNTLRAILGVKEKNDRILKGRTYANGRK